MTHRKLSGFLVLVFVAALAARRGQSIGADVTIDTIDAAATADSPIQTEQPRYVGRDALRRGV